MKDAIVFAVILFSWIALNRWILPWFGIQTCMGGACRHVSTDQTAVHCTVPADDDQKTSADGDCKPDVRDRSLISQGPRS